MLANGSIVDDLARLREEIRRLKAREAALREDLVARCPMGRVAGRSFVAEIGQQRRRVFERDRLAPEILADPRYWREARSAVVVVKPLDRAPPVQTAFWGEMEEEIELIEPFD